MFPSSSNSILFEKQFNFRHIHSTTNTQMEITEKIKQACDSGQYACGVLLDFRKGI